MSPNGMSPCYPTKKPVSVQTEFDFAKEFRPLVSIPSVWVRPDGLCAIEQFYRNNPPGTVCMMTCNCPRHTVMC